MSIVNGSAVNFYVSANGFAAKRVLLNLNIIQFTMLSYILFKSAFYTMFIFNYQIRCMGRQIYTIPFHNLSGKIDIRISQHKLKKNKDKMLRILRKKLKDQSITVVRAAV